MADTTPTPTDLPEALRLAECLERDCDMNWPDHDNQMNAAAELRRLHALTVPAEAVDKESLTAAQPQAGAPAVAPKLADAMPREVYAKLNALEALCECNCGPYPSSHAAHCPFRLSCEIQDLLNTTPAPQAGAESYPAEPTPDELRAIAREARNSSGSASDDCGPAAYVLYGWRAATAALRARGAVPSDRTALAKRLIGEVVEADRVATAVCRTVAELPDRDSPPDWPLAMLVTSEELHSIVCGAIFDATPAAPMSAQAPSDAPFQQRVQPWMQACFGPAISADREERNHRFLEEALELVQATGCTASEAHQLVDYVYGRPVGEPVQEVGGVMVTLAALCLANGLDMHTAAETELARIWTKVEAIRAKQAAKPKHSPLPEAAAPQPPAALPGEQDTAREWTREQVTAFCSVALRNVGLVNELGPTLAEVRQGVAAAMAAKGRTDGSAA